MRKLNRLHRSLALRLSAVPISDALIISHRYFCAWEDGEISRPWPDIPEAHREAPVFQLQILPWQFELLLKECFRSSPSYGTKCLSVWGTVADALNHLKDVCDASWGNDRAELIWYEMFRIPHLQFPWQSYISGRTVARYFELYEDHRLAEMLQENTGLTRAQYFKLTFAAYGFFSEEGNHFLEMPIDTSGLGISSEQAFTILRRISAPVSEFKLHSKDSGTVDVNFPYRRSLLEKKPLIFLDSGEQQGFLCPIPRHLISRMLDGLFYDLQQYRSFGDYYGQSFQRYVLNVCRWIDRESLSVFEEQEYRVGTNRLDSLDILLRDMSADLFVECKTRRVSERAKFDLSTKDPIKEEMGKMIKSIVRTYKNLNDGLLGRYPHWTPGETPIYLLIVFLTDWYIFSRDLRDHVFEMVDQELSAMEIDPNIRSRVKVTTCSADEFEMLASVLRQKTIEDVFSLKTDLEHEAWQMRSFLNEHFRAEIEQSLPLLSTFDRYFEEMLEPHDT
jgi:hypothetical protein